jgi:alpha-tubulin suppressor-like RCC1 family protein
VYLSAVTRWTAAAAVVLVAATGIALGASTRPAEAAVPPITAIATSGFHTCALKQGRAYCWGHNNHGQLGDGTTTNRTAPVPVETGGALAGKTLVDITTGIEHTCALDDDGAAYCWGWNVYAQLGDGTKTSHVEPVPVDTGGAIAGKTLVDIVGGETHTCALDDGGAPYCWGRNVYGQLGDGSTTESASPVAVETGGALAGNTLVGLASGNDHVCALDEDGAAYCWGWSGYGQLGNGSTGGSSTPVAAGTGGATAGKTLTAITAGGYHTCALDDDGAAYCWGRNDFGELGDDTSTQRAAPVAVVTSGALAGKTVSELAAGGMHTCALDDDGAAYCWGRNDSGQLGNGSTNWSNAPVAIDGSGALAGKTIASLSAGYVHACVLTADGRAYCWGQGSYGALGDGTGAGTATAVAVVTPPDQPRQVSVEPGDESVRVSWRAGTDPGTGETTGYTATVAPAGDAASSDETECDVDLQPEAIPDEPSCTIEGLTNGEEYTVTVVAHGADGDSAASEPVEVTPELAASPRPSAPGSPGESVPATAVGASDGLPATGRDLVAFLSAGAALLGTGTLAAAVAAAVRGRRRRAGP